MQWREPHWRRTCHEVGGRAWKHGKSNWFRGAEGAVAEMLGPGWPNAAVDRRA